MRKEILECDQSKHCQLEKCRDEKIFCTLIITMIVLRCLNGHHYE